MGVINNHAYYRVAGYAATLALHGGNSIAMFLALRTQEDLMKDPEIRTFHSLQWVYITIWNILFQMLYSCLGMLCDLPALLEIKEHKLTKIFRSYREVVFAGLILPIGLLIVILFWPVYLYDRDLVFPVFIDKVLSPVSNHIMHTAILPIILWEFIFLPKLEPKSHRWNIAHLFGCFVYYLYVLFTTFARRGVWPYPLLKLFYGTIFFPILFITICVILFVFYYGQWRVNALFWRSNVNTKKKVNYK